jgi:peptide-methionine (S)-S-oxide reductase
MKLFVFYLLVGAMFSVEACDGTSEEGNPSFSEDNPIRNLDASQLKNLDTATLAGGCFWCVEAAFEQINGVYEVVSGYSGGTQSNPTYSQVSRGATNHAEAVQVYYNAEKLSYNKILEIFFTAHDPTQLNRQGPDVGKQYRSAIYYHNEQQRKLAEAMIASMNSEEVFSKDIVTQLEPLNEFWIAEEYHQDYAERNPQDRYIQSVSIPKVNKVKKAFPDLIN